jgi:hypothetical protein
MFTFHVPVVIFACYPFRADDGSVISDSPVKEDQTVQSADLEKGSSQWGNCFRYFILKKGSLSKPRGCCRLRGDGLCSG